jgi:hypothetical protein
MSAAAVADNDHVNDDAYDSVDDAATAVSRAAWEHWPRAAVSS